jgi:hypothetical protein
MTRSPLFRSIQLVKVPDSSWLFAGKAAATIGQEGVLKSSASCFRPSSIAATR